MNKIRFALIKDTCQTNAWPYYQITRPQRLNFIVRGLAEKKFQSISYGLANVFVAYVENMRVFGQGFLLSQQHEIFVHGLTHGHYKKALRCSMEMSAGFVTQDDGIYENLAPVSESIDEAVLVWGGKNFGHWLFQYVMRLASLEYYPELKQKNLLIQKDVPKRYLDFLLLLGFKKEQFVFADSGVLVKKLWLPAVVTYQGHYKDTCAYLWPEALHHMRTKILGEQAYFPPATVKRTRVYISRAKAKWRRIIAEEQLIHKLEALGFQSVSMEDLSVSDQIALAANAEIMIFTPGAADQIAMFSAIDCSIIALTSNSFASERLAMWQHVLGQQHIRLIGEEIRDRDINTDLPQSDFDLAIDQDELMTVVHALVQQKYQHGLSYADGLSEQIF